MTEVQTTSQDKFAGLADWMHRYAAGDDLAFAELYRALAPTLRALIRRRVNDAASVEDIVQGTFFKAHLARERFAAEISEGGDRAVATWYIVIARNTATDFLRKTGRSRLQDVEDRDVSGSTLDDFPSPQPNAEETLASTQSQAALTTWLRQALLRLPEAHREAVELHKLQGLPMAKIAEMQGARLGTVRVRAHRAYQQLSAMWAERGPHELVH